MSLTPQLPRKRDRIRKIFGGSRSPSTPPETLPTATRTPPSQDPASLGSRSSILTDALEVLTLEDRDTIRSLLPADAINIDAAFRGAHDRAVELQRLCAKKTWSWQYKDRQIYLSDYSDKVLQLLDQFKSTGDVVANINPVYIGLPWAGIRVILEVCHSLDDGYLWIYTNYIFTRSP
jgi:hypothetical protein